MYEGSQLPPINHDVKYSTQPESRQKAKDPGGSFGKSLLSHRDFDQKSYPVVHSSQYLIDYSILGVGFYPSAICVSNPRVPRVPVSQVPTSSYFKIFQKKKSSQVTCCCIFFSQSELSSSRCSGDSDSNCFKQLWISS